MHKGRAIVTEMTVGPVGELLALDLWNADDAATVASALGVALPGPGQAEGAVLRVGPRRWWLVGTNFDRAGLAAALNGTGVVSAVAGGWVHVQLSGVGWRDLIMQSGLIDAEDAGFGPGTVAVTPLSHSRCVVHVRAATQCDVFVPASYADHCLSAWRAMGAKAVA